MANWVSGLSFFTCEHGGRHLLPMFYAAPNKVFSLVNLKGSYGDDSDYIKLDLERRRCNCGRPVLPFTFVSHCNQSITRCSKEGTRETWIDSVIEDFDLPNRLSGWYHNLQFVQTGGKVFVLRCCYTEPPESDEDEIRRVFDGLTLEFLDDKILQVGVGKRPAFWATETMPLLLDWAIRPTVTSTRWLL
jgi:hypothetical protein